MKKLIGLILFVTGTAQALEPGDYGYGYQYHGYNSLEQQQEAEHNQRTLQQIEQTQLDLQLNNRLNGGQPPQFREEGNMLEQTNGLLDQ
jgi:hypothetical protein